MVFSSLSFLYLFLPLTLILYYITPRKFCGVILLTASLVFYMWGDAKNIYIMIVTALINYFGALIIAKSEKKSVKKIALGCSVGLSVLILFYFKYMGLIADVFLLNISVPALPVGISFYTFQAISYTVDCYRNDVKCEKNPFEFLTYITLFPQLIAGPIVRYSDVAPSLREKNVSVRAFGDGAVRFTAGLCKKVILANSLGYYFEQLKAAENTGALGAWVGIICYALQIYYDFSGYSDMAIGIGKMLGFDFCENFNYPYISASVTEFWRRWHISLSSWFKDYVYIPLGGSRHGMKRTILNLLCVWALTGLWHGASLNFLFWGIYYFVLLVAEKLWLKKFLDAHRIFGHVYTMFTVTLGWVIFAFDDVSKLLGYLGSMFAPSDLVGEYSAPLIISALPVMAAGVIGSAPFVRTIAQKYKAAYPVLMAAGLLLCTVFIISDGYNPFLYFRF